MKHLLIVCSVILVSSLSAFAQGTVDERGVYHPTEQEIAANKRHAELFKHPTFIILRLASHPRQVPQEAATDTPAPYKVKDYVGFELFMTQNSLEIIRLLNEMSPYYEYRPELMRDGDVLPYSEQAKQRVERAENKPHSGSVLSVTLRPGEENRWVFIDLDNWYEPLAPGRYKLTVRKQFVRDGDWVVSNPVYFEVIPRTPGSPIPPGVTIELTPQGVEPRKIGRAS